MKQVPTLFEWAGDLRLARDTGGSERKVLGRIEN
jgi:hypothetical protein